MLALVFVFENVIDSFFHKHSLLIYASEPISLHSFLFIRTRILKLKLGVLKIFAIWASIVLNMFLIWNVIDDKDNILFYVAFVYKWLVYCKMYYLYKIKCMLFEMLYTLSIFLIILDFWKKLPVFLDFLLIFPWIFLCFLRFLPNLKLSMFLKCS